MKSFVASTLRAPDSCLSSASFPLLATISIPRSPGTTRKILTCFPGSKSRSTLPTTALLKNPLYAFVLEPVRRALLRKFPYAIYYVNDGPDVTVIAVLHHKRDPRIWKRRVRSTL